MTWETEGPQVRKARASSEFLRKDRHAEGFSEADYPGLEYAKSLKGRKVAQEGSHLLAPHQAPGIEQGAET